MSLFATRLAALGFASYADYLASPLWASFKGRYIAARLSRKCAVCGERKVQLHHHTYVRLGVEEFSDVTPLCREHHQVVHACLKEKEWFVEKTYACIALLRGEEIPEVAPRKKDRRKASSEAAQPRMSKKQLAKHAYKDRITLREEAKKAKMKEDEVAFREWLKTVKPAAPIVYAAPPRITAREQNNGCAEMNRRLREIRERRKRGGQ